MVVIRIWKEVIESEKLIGGMKRQMGFQDREYRLVTEMPFVPGHWNEIWTKDEQRVMVTIEEEGQ